MNCNTTHYRANSSSVPGDPTTEAARNRAIPWGEARELRNQLRQVQPLAWKVEHGQASQWEYRRLTNVVSRIERATQGYAQNGRYPRYGYNERRY